MSNVINLFDKKIKKTEDKKNQEEEVSFEEIIKRNKQNEERIRKERDKKNKQTIRSYRLKD